MLLPTYLASWILHGGGKEKVTIINIIVVIIANISADISIRTINSINELRTNMGAMPIILREERLNHCCRQIIKIKSTGWLVMAV